MFLEITLIIGLTILAIDSFFFIGYYGKISELTVHIKELVDFITFEEEEDEETQKIREYALKTMFS